MRVQNCISILFVGIVLSFITTSCTSSKGGASGKSEMTIAFGSCNHHDDPQTIWGKVSKNKPDLWIWTGDIVYADTDDMSVMKSKYDIQKANPDYSKFASSTDVIGIWDDHDYGKNNAGKEYAKKDSAKLMLFDFLNVPADSPAREREGAHQSYMYNQNGLIVKVLLLDGRYFRDTPGESNTSILGSSQWRWLINELNKNEADAHVIVSGVQILPVDHKFEKWANFTAERERLLNIIDQLDVNNTILISGDRHIGELSLVGLPQTGLPVLEITSSGLTHYYEDFPSEENRYRVGEVVASLNFGVLTITKSGSSISYDASIRDEKNKEVIGINSNSLVEELGMINEKIGG